MHLSSAAEHVSHLSCQDLNKHAPEVKHQEVSMHACCGQVDEFCYITDNTYSRKEILGMEDCVLDSLRFELTVPTPRLFLRRFLKASAADWPSCGIWQ